MVTASIVDGLGRGYQVKKNAEVDGKRQMIVSGLTKFDRLGREIAHYAPSVCNLNDFGYSSYEKLTQLDEIKYDKFDRPVEQTAFSKYSDAYTTYTSYEIEEGKLKTHVQDKNGEKNVLSVSTYSDGSEHTLKTVKEHKDKDGGAPATTIFDFDGIGQLLKVTDPAGAETKYEYDMAGRKLSVDNLSAGKTTFTYDNLGNVLTKTTGKGDVVTYKYEYNRLVEQIYGNDKWRNNVKYTYGGVDAKHNRVGRLALVEDGSGAQEYFYGKMGEVEKIRRTIIIPGVDVATYTTEWKYDSWNRIQEMIYPDGEKIKYYYNLGGQLQRILGQKNYICTYIDSIRYDKYEQRSYIKYGNGTETTYDYDPVNRRLDTMTVSNEKSKAEGAKGLFLNNIYKYDAAGNITSVENTAALNSGIGGTMSHTYDYDDWYRLKTANGVFESVDKAKRAEYSLTMGYDNIYNITSKKMTMSQTNLQFAGTLSAGHEFIYNYSNDNPMQLASVETKQYNVDGEVSDVDAKLADNQHVQNYEFDANGNMTSVSVASLKPETQEPETTEATEEKDVLKSFLWDEENRLLAVNNNGSVSCYFYDAAGERTVKLTSESEMVHVNGKKVGGNANINKFTAYVSPYFVVSNGGAYTKHIYAASQRIASKLGNVDGFGADPRRVEMAGGKKISDIQKDNIGARYKELGFSYSTPEKEKVEKDSTMDSEEPENLVFFYHPDHLGSTSYVTDADGNIAQHVEYIPYGEVFVEERNSQFSTNFLFNAKELDNETGLYYYGARYLDPTGAMWLSVDPMWEDRPGISPFNYCLSNPIKMIDPDGMWEQDADGNWIAQKNDNAYTLAKALNVNPSDAIQMMKDQGFEFTEGDKKVLLNVGDVFQSKQSSFNMKETMGDFSWYPQEKGLEDVGVLPYVDVAIEQLLDLGERGLQYIGVSEDNSQLTCAAAAIFVSFKGGKMPKQVHHYATNKNKRFTPIFKQIASKYGLSLNGDWNKELLPHLGRHPNEYHEFVLKRMKMAQRQAGACKDKFLSLFEKYVKQPIRNNPEKLKKSGWKKH